MKNKNLIIFHILAGSLFLSFIFWSQLPVLTFATQHDFCKCVDGNLGKLEGDRCYRKGEICDGKCRCVNDKLGEPRDGQCFLNNIRCDIKEESAPAKKEEEEEEREEEEEEERERASQREPVVRKIIDVLVLLDVSGSMGGFMLKERSKKINAAKAALSDLVKNASASVRFQLWTFSATIVQHPVGVKKNVFKQGKFQAIDSKGSDKRQNFSAIVKNVEIPQDASVTNLYAAILQALNYLQSPAYNSPQTNVPVTKILLVLSDGIDDRLSPIRLGDISIAKDKFTDVQIKTIGFGVQTDGALHRELCYIATNKECALIQNSTQLRKVLGDFVDLKPNQ